MISRGEGSESGAPSSIRVTVVLNEQKNLNLAMGFLRRRGYNLMVSNTVIDAIRKLQSFRPHVIVLSWNLRGTNIRKIFRLLSQALNVVCIVFNEDTGVKSATGLMGSGIPNTLLAPVSGPGMHMRIQSLLRKKRIEAQQKATEESLEKFKNLPHATNRDNFPLTYEVPATTKWEKEESGSANMENTWKGTHTDEDGNKKVFFFQGPKAPEFDAKSEKWKNLDMGGPVTQETQESSSTLNKAEPIVPSEFEDPKFDWNKAMESLVKDVNSAKKDPSDEFDYNPSITHDPLLIPNSENKYEGFHPVNNPAITPEEKDPFEHKTMSGGEATKLLQNEIIRKKASILAYGVRSAVENTAKPTGKSPPPTLKYVSKLNVTVIETKRFRGYLVACNSADLPDALLLEKVMEKLRSKLEDHGEPLRPVTRVLEIQFDPIEFSLWAQNSAEFTVTTQHGDHQVIFAYVPLESIPEVLPHENEDVFAVNLEKDLTPDVKLNFDLYLHMPKNNKYILYHKKNAVLSAKTIEKLMRFGIGHVFIKAGDKDAFYSYCARNHILQSA